MRVSVVQIGSACDLVVVIKMIGRQGCQGKGQEGGGAMVVMFAVFVLLCRGVRPGPGRVQVFGPPDHGYLGGCVGAVPG